VTGSVVGDCGGTCCEFGIHAVLQGGGGDLWRVVCGIDWSFVKSKVGRGVCRKDSLWNTVPCLLDT